jgi:hypothetical protein
MVAVFVRYQDRIEVGVIYANQCETAQNLSRAKTGIHQHICFFGADKNRVSGRTAAENCNFHIAEAPAS